MLGSATETLRSTRARWRTVDIVVASVIAVAGGVVFWDGRNSGPLLWAFAGFPPAQAVMYASGWHLGDRRTDHQKARCGAVHGVDRVDRRGVARQRLGLSVVAYGLAEGAAPELVFLAFRYRNCDSPSRCWQAQSQVLRRRSWTSSTTTAPGERLEGHLHRDRDEQFAAGGRNCGAFLVKALARTGVLQPFASGRRAAVS